jgi:glycosyltransferase involved in cell wall biosynthesis
MFDIVMPLYNKANFVPETVESALAQTFRDWTLLVVDDGSTDGSVAAVEAFNDPRIRVLRQTNAGPGAARNLGITSGTSDWIAFLDADDVWLPDHLAVLDSIRRRFPEAALIGSAFVPWEGEARMAPAARAGGDPRLIRYFHEVASGRAPFFTSSAAFSRRAVNSVGLLKPVMMEDETEFWARLALHGPVAASARETVLYRVATGGLTDNWVPPVRLPWDELRLEDVSLTLTPVLERLPDVTDPLLKRDLESFVDYVLELFLLRAMRNGQVRYARKLSRFFIAGPRGKARAAAALAFLPAPFGQRLLGLIFAVKRLLRRSPVGAGA